MENRQDIYGERRMNNKNLHELKEYVKRHEIISTLIFSFTIMFGFIAGSGIISSGYHFVDDHEYISCINTMSQDGFLSLMRQYVKEDFNIRYRPTYIIMRVIGVRLFGLNMVLWHIAKTCEAAIAAALLYLVARKRKCSVLFSAIFAGLVLLGNQSEILWRLGPQELTGIVFLCCVVLSLERYIRKHTTVNFIMLLFFLIVFQGVKESFFIMMPFFIFYGYFIECCDNDDASASILSFMEYFKRNIVFIITDLLITIIAAYFIVCHVGTNSIGYAGIDSSFSITDYLISIMEMVTSESFQIVGAIVLISVFYMLISSLYFDSFSLGKKEQIKKYIFGIVLCCYIVFSQLILYAKSGMLLRYYVPFVIGIFVFVVIIMQKYLFKHRKAYFIYAVILLCYIGYLFHDVADNAREYAADGKSTTQMLDYVQKIVETENVDIVCALDPELNYSASTYINYSNLNKTAVMYLYDPDDNIYDFHRDVFGEMDKYSIHNADDDSDYSFDTADMYIGYNSSGEGSTNIINNLLELYGIEEDYNTISFDNYVVYLRKTIEM